MLHQVFTQAMKEIDELALLAELTLAQLQHKTEELKNLYQKHQEAFPNPALLGDSSSQQQPQK